MTSGWLVVALVAGSALVAKAAGPVLLGDWQPPPRLAAGFRLLAPAVLAALVVSHLFVSDGRLSVDASLAGFAAGVVAWRLRRGVLTVVIVAIAVTALVRLSGLAP
jgi:branched-subunit amino acid transport protein